MKKSQKTSTEMENWTLNRLVYFVLLNMSHGCNNILFVANKKNNVYRKVENKFYKR